MHAVRRYLFQSTRPRGTRHRFAGEGDTAVSFNPRVRAGRDVRAQRAPRRCSCFNPRVRAGRDPCRLADGKHHTVSIHASARDATRSDAPIDSTPTTFQSTRPRGTRRGRVQRQSGAHAFQSTRPRGTRPVLGKSLHGWSSFNPRVRAGRDILDSVEKRFGITFQSTRPRGTRR